MPMTSSRKRFVTSPDIADMRIGSLISRMASMRLRRSKVSIEYHQRGQVIAEPKSATRSPNSTATKRATSVRAVNPASAWPVRASKKPFMMMPARNGRMSSIPRKKIVVRKRTGRNLSSRQVVRPMDMGALIFIR